MKNFIAGGIVGGIVEFFLGWLFYGTLFKGLYPSGGDNHLMFIILGCFASGFFLSYIFNKWAGISRVKTGLTAGATIGLLNGLMGNLYISAGEADFCIKSFLLKVVLGVVSTAIMGAAIAFVNGKMNDEAAS